MKRIPKSVLSTFAAMGLFSLFTFYMSYTLFETKPLPVVAGAEISKDQDNDETLNPDYVADVPDSAVTISVPILMYHHIGPLPEKQADQKLFVTPAMFEQQMAYLSDQQYQTLDSAQFYAALKDGNTKPRSVMITFDDGYEDNYKIAFPILQRYHLSAVFFIPLQKSEITTTQLQEMADAGMDIESHSLNHVSMRRIKTTAQLEGEIVGSKNALAEVTGKPITAFAYPYCVTSDESIRQIEQAGYLLAFICKDPHGDSIKHSYSGRFVLGRLWIYNNLDNFKQRLQGIEKIPEDLGKVDPYSVPFSYHVL